MAKKLEKYHVVFDKEDDLWKVNKQGAERASATSETKAEIITKAKELAQKAGGGSVKIHTQDGKIQEERTYPKSKDPKESKG